MRAANILILLLVGSGGCSGDDRAVLMRVGGEEGAVMWSQRLALEEASAPFGAADHVVIHSREPCGGLTEVQAFDAATGEKADPRFDAQDVIAAADAMVITAYDGGVHAFAADSGTLSWTFELPPNSATERSLLAAITPGLVVLDELNEGQATSTLYGLDRETGEERWRSPFSVEVILENGWSADRIVVRSASGSSAVHGVELADGTVAWTVDDVEFIAANGTIAVVSPRLAQPRAFDVLDLASGSLLWTVTALQVVLGQQVLVTRELERGGDPDIGPWSWAGRDAASGEEIWRASQSGDFHKATMTQGTLLQLDEQRLRAFDATSGALLWSLDVAPVAVPWLWIGSNDAIYVYGSTSRFECST